MTDEIDQDVREAAYLWMVNGEWDEAAIAQAFARMKEAGRQQGLREAAEVARKTGTGCATAFTLSESQNKWRAAAWAGASEHIASAITALMEGEGDSLHPRGVV